MSYVDQLVHRIASINHELRPPGSALTGTGFTIDDRNAMSDPMIVIVQLGTGGHQNRDRWTPKPVDDSLVKTQEVSRVVLRGANYGNSFKHGGIMSSCFMNLHLCAYVCNHHVVYKDQGDTLLLLTI